MLSHIPRKDCGGCTPFTNFIQSKNYIIKASLHFAFLVVLIIGLPLLLSAQTLDSVSGDRQALVDLYQATGGPGWDN
ncbi:hypothetical protein ACG2F4_15665, partial [Halalkalibaculum sp. DA3122]|uniref:hypothetical protein n=1 Tax=Halalkalibaculum sp. DA384 TaxID=3373606 RepID=UPI0037551DED